jgi:hypothetical protein
MPSSFNPRYDHIVSLVLVVVLGLAVVLIIDMNPNILRARLGGDFPTITVSWVLIAALVAITATGADLLVRSHPQMQTRTLPTLNLGVTKVELAPGFWILPSFSVVGSFAFFRLFNDTLHGASFVLTLLATGGILLLVLTSQHYALDRQQPVRDRSRLILQTVTYVLAFGCFSAVYFTRFRTLYAATLISTVAVLLSYEILQWTPRRGQMSLALIVGLMMGEMTWALNYWSASFVIGGLLLLVVFYTTVSLLQHHAAGTLQRNLLIEYGLLGVGLFLALVYATFRGSP